MTVSHGDLDDDNIGRPRLVALHLRAFFGRTHAA
jgi:hypothetical protein